MWASEARAAGTITRTLATTTATAGHRTVIHPAFRISTDLPFHARPGLEVSHYATRQGGRSRGAAVRMPLCAGRIELGDTFATDGTGQGPAGTRPVRALGEARLRRPHV